ncbi:MAG: hypothetical protein M5R36_27590 [Deltaproteobacteria bacterium]|nr:hypothetical protein [Deltaproteobacteria bacterium]
MPGQRVSCFAPDPSQVFAGIEGETAAVDATVEGNFEITVGEGAECRKTAGAVEVADGLISGVHQYYVVIWWAAPCE